MTENSESSSGVPMPEEELKLLEEFVYDNPELERLEAVLDDFNPFVAMRWVKQEARHSSFLRWLLDPLETHGLGAYFLRAFLKGVAHRSATLSSATPSVFDVDSWDLTDTEVVQERSNIDLLIRNDADGFVAVIENKIDSGEHSRQLQRYRSVVERQFPQHKKLYAFLTVGGAAPSDENYAAVDHAEVVDLIRTTLARREDQLSNDVRTFLSHYVEMVRRHIVENSEVQEICRQIYAKHKKALDVLFEHRPDRASEIASVVRGLIAERQDLIEDHCSKASIRFIPDVLDFLPRVGDGWTSTKRMLLFEFENYRDKLTLKMILGPGPQELRRKIHETITRSPKLFNRSTQKLYPKWWSFHREAWLGAKRYSEIPLPELQIELAERFASLATEKVPAIAAALEPLKAECSQEVG